jgi:hypothetical protein
MSRRAYGSPPVLEDLIEQGVAVRPKAGGATA